MKIVPIQFNEKEPLYIQLSQALQKQLAESEAGEGDRLPAIRKLAQVLGINNGTVVRAYKDLEQRGLVYAKRGSGYHIVRRADLRADSREPAVHKINFASATPNPNMFPVAAFKACMNLVLDRDRGYAFEYLEGGGYLPLRESLCAYFLREKGIRIAADCVVIVSGAQQGIDLIAKAYIQAEDCVLTENPTYMGAVRIFESRGARVVGVPMDGDGMKLLELEAAVIEHRPKLLYMMSRYQNPTAVCYSKYKMKQLLLLAEKYNFFLVEDDSLSELSYRQNEKDDISKLLYGHERVITVKSFSKLLMPGLRLGFLVLPPSEIPSVLQAKYVTDISTSGLIQRTVDIYFRSGRWAVHVEDMRRSYAENYRQMKQALLVLEQAGVTYTDPQGGVFFWLRLPPHISAYALQRRCLEKNVQVASGHLFALKSQQADDALRLSFAAVQPNEIAAGIAVIRACMAEMEEERRQENYGLPWI